MAHGEYIGIVESDDFAAPEMMERLYRTAAEYDADMVKGNYYSYQTEENKSTYYEYLRGKPYAQLLNQDECMRLAVAEPAIWCGIYKKSFLKDNKIDFLPTPGASYQDMGFSFKTAICANRVVLVKEAVLYYRIDNPNSSVKDNKKVFCLCDEFAELDRFIKQREDDKEARSVYTVDKYYRYKWNLSRLTSAAQYKFLLKMYFELRKASFAGLFDKKYMPDGEWEDLHTLMFNLPEFYTGKIAELEPGMTTPDVLIHILKHIPDLYIYGAGKRTAVLLEFMAQNEIDIEGLLVSAREGNPDRLQGIPVIRIDEMTEKIKDVFIIIGVAEPAESEVVSNLQAKGIHNFVVLDNITYQMVVRRCK
jgi:hypothetical protein